MNGCFPFRGSTDKELYRRICRGTYVMHNKLVSEQFLLFLEKMINTNADDRPTAEELLKNEWFTCEPSKGPDSQAQSITDQKKIFKAKILSKVPIEKSNNNICLLSSDKNPIKLSSHNINLNQGTTQFRSNPLV
jgi:serine/threonine protein kinase